MSKPNSMTNAATKACDAYSSVRRSAERLKRELDDTTAPHGIPVVDLPEDDSMVTAVASGVAAAKR